MKKQIFSAILWCVLFILSYKPAVAHVGGGPPFLMVNGVYAQTNPYYFNGQAITIPQDFTGKTYTVHTPITLFVDTKQLLVPPDVANASTFRWTMAEGSKEHSFGQKLVYSYNKPGSYIISLEVKAPGETNFLLIDTVQLDILPNATYKLPQVHIAVATDHRQGEKPMVFQSNFSVDPATKIASTTWGFGDGKTATQPTVLHTYTNLPEYATIPVVFRVQDTNHFSSYAGVILISNKGTLHFVDTVGKENPIPVQDTLPKIVPDTKMANKKTILSLPLFLGGFFVGLSVIAGILLLKKHRTKN